MEPPKISVPVRHAEYSVIMSADDDPAGAVPDELLAIALAAAGKARQMPMAGVSERMKSPPFYPDIWPGEHYKLLAALVENLKPAVVIEIGTFTGLSALAMLSTLPDPSHLYTFDVLPWPRIDGTCLIDDDFKSGRLNQIVANVGEISAMQSHSELFRSADLIFVDGPKDGVFEEKFLANLDQIGLPRKPLLVFDDIRVWKMLGIWRAIRKPKLDLTSFGHWSGTGLVRWE